MINSLYLNNFRCFRDLEITDFGRLTIISGKNNIGKTALLESIFLAYGYDIPDLFFKINFLRNIQLTTFVPDITWNHLFYRKNIDNEIKINIASSDNNFLLSFQIDDTYQLSQMSSPIFNGTQGNMLSQSLQSQFGNSSPMGSPLKIVYHGEVTRIGHYIPMQNGLLANWDTPRQQNNVPVVQYIGYHTDNTINIAQQFGRIEKDGNKDILVKALKQLEPDFDDAVVIMEDVPRIYARRKNGPLLPLAVLGNGMMRMLQIICAMLQTSNTIILIDEIEIGFHHSFLRNMWKVIETILNENKVQLIATTHSYECLQAAAEILSQNSHSKYIRLEKYDDIIYPYTFSLDELKFSLSHNMEIR